MTTSLSRTRVKASQKRARAITWAQISLEASEDLRDLIGRQPRAAQLILAIIERMEPGSGGVVVVSRVALTEIVGASLPTIDRALKLLIEEGWVQRIRLGGTYGLAINHRVAWIGQRGDIQHAVFGATVIASRSEQDGYSLNPPPIRYVPTLIDGDEATFVGVGRTPPSQKDLEGFEVALVPGEQLDAATGEILRIGDEGGEK